MESELPFRIILPLLFMTFIVHRGYYSRRYRPSEAETVEKRAAGTASRIANLLSIAALLSSVAYVAFPMLVGWASLALPSWVRWTGLGVAASGFALLQWSHATLGRNWSDQPRILKDQELVKDGPYQWVRHPIYDAFLLILGSTLLITSNWLIGGLWLLVTSIDIRDRIAYEEEAMLARFGEEYRSYMRNTGALVPRIG